MISSINLQLATVQIPVAQAQTLTVSQPIIQPIPVKLEDPVVVSIPTKKTPVAIVPAALKKVAYCESGNRQVDSKGNIITNKKTKDYGRYQINAMHISTAKKLGYNIFTDAGNTGFALYLYKTQGLAPWSASRSCLARFGIEV